MSIDYTKPGRRKVGERLSVALDGARAGAAFYVVAHHVTAIHGWSIGGPGLVFRFGQEAVVVFFLLSGFVIFANERGYAEYPTLYYIRRCRRIFPVLLAALLLSCLVALDNGNFSTLFRWKELVGTLLCMQDISLLKPGVITDPFMGNGPLWSLSYEMTFYLVFPLALVVWTKAPKIATAFIGAICCIAYASYSLFPNHFSLVSAYFLVWWCGAMAANAYEIGARDFRSMLPNLYWLVALCLTATAVACGNSYEGLGRYPFLPLRHFVCALVLLIVLFGPVGRKLVANLFVPEAILRCVAVISYGIYAFHVPLLVKWNRAQGYVGFANAVLLLFILAYTVDFRLTRALSRTIFVFGTKKRSDATVRRVAEMGAIQPRGD